MAITYNWTINPLEAYPLHGGETDVVFTAHWQLHATSGSLEESGSIYTATSIGTERVTYHSGSEFIPFENLTLEIVQGWVEGAMGEEQVNNMKAALATQIENKINPPVVTLQSPWLPTGSL
jgi:hypothetical protein